MSQASKSVSNRNVETSFTFDKNEIVSKNILLEGRRIKKSYPRVDSLLDEPFKASARASLDSHPVAIESEFNGRRLNIIDIFCGGGGLSLGASSALKMLGHQVKFAACVDKDALALKLTARHFKPAYAEAKDVTDLISYAVDHSLHLDKFVSEPKIKDSRISQFRGKIDVLIGGPPCQGHSTLNNRTRGNDSRNLLYYTMPAFAVALDVPYVLIENVAGIRRSSEQVLQGSKKLFEGAGYYVYEFLLRAVEFGVPQTRVRHFCVASKKELTKLSTNLESLKLHGLTFDDVNWPLEPLGFSNKLLEKVSELSEENQARIDFLHSDQSFDLPNELRPDCHKDGHTYPAVYGRLDGDKPSGTITTGFGSPGRGRFIHPHLPRTINNREASRLQMIPDWYWEPCDDLGFYSEKYRKVIGDAVPPDLATNIILASAEAFI